MNLSEATKLVAMLKSVYVREQFTDDSPTAFLWLLEDKRYEEVLAAAKIHGMRSKWCPTPAELRDIIAEQNTVAISHGEGWDQVRRQILRHGVSGYADATFEHPAVAEAVRAVGWKRLCLEETKYMIPEFNKALDAAQQRQRRDVQDGTAALVGDMANGVNGIAERSGS